MNEGQKMTAKPIIWIFGALLIVAVGVIVYLLMRNDATTDDDAGQNINTAAAENSNAPGNANSREESAYIGEGFTVTQPAGWTQGKIMGTIASFVKTGETFPQDSAAGKINFQSYIAVSFDNTNGKTLTDVYDLSIDTISKIVSSLNVFATSDETVNGLPAKFSAMEFTQQDVEYTVLVAIMMAGDKYYSMSFNTTTDRWLEYKDMFYDVARSFRLK